LSQKVDMKKRGMPSPDEADAVELCFSEPGGSPIVRSKATGFNRTINYPTGRTMRSKGIKSVVVTTTGPSGPGDYGTCAEGFYFVEHGTLTMCDRDGVPSRDENNGRQIAMRLPPGEDEKVAAKKLTLQQYCTANRDEMAGFGRSIRYPSRGWA
jgi:hypothetical protein